MYEGFANVYDHMMNHIPYEEWFEQIKNYLTEKGITGGKMCELGCGTGAMTERFAKAGFQMIGIDKSVEMLSIAENKKQEENLDIFYSQQDMESFALTEPVDAIISVCDTVNYLLQEEALINTFHQVKEFLKPQGYFLFDLKTAYCYRNIIGNQTWVEQDEEVSYIWENYFYEDQDINEYMLTIFRKKEDSQLYEKVEEAHYQRAYSIPQLKECLEEAGLELVDCFDENMENAPKDNSERIYVVAKVKIS